MKLKKTDRRFKLHHLGFEWFIDFTSFGARRFRFAENYITLFRKLHGPEYSRYFRKDGKWYYECSAKHVRIFFKNHKMLTTVQLSLPEDMNR